MHNIDWEADAMQLASSLETAKRWFDHTNVGQEELVRSIVQLALLKHNTLIKQKEIE